MQQSHGKQRIVFALNTRSSASAIKYARVICQRLDERWLPMQLDAMGLEVKVVPVRIKDQLPDNFTKEFLIKRSG